MAKFDSSQYKALWSAEGIAIQQAILNDPEFIKANFTFWRDKFSIDPSITPTNDSGSAVFISKMRQLETGVMMDMRAPLGDGTPQEFGNEASYTGVIPDFIGKTYRETAQEREYKERLFDQFGDATLLASYAENFLQRAMDSANMTLSHMGAQLMSKGYIHYQQGEGIQMKIYKADIPASNFKKAGAKVWSDKTCKLLDQWRKFVEDANDAFGIDIAWQLEITKDMLENYVMTNEQVIEHLRWVNNVNGVLLPATEHVTREMVMNVLANVAGIPKIVIIEEHQKDVTNGKVHGWDDNVAVLRPLGLAGVIRHTTNLDSYLSKYKNSLYEMNFTSAMDGLLTICNSVIPNGKYKEWQAEPMMQAIPSLDEFLYHIIIKTNQAD